MVINAYHKSFIVAALLVMFFVPWPSHNLWWREAGNSGHTVVFFLLSFVIYQLISRRFSASRSTIYLVVLVAGLCLGILLEVLQNLSYREPSLDDIFRDGYGLIAGLCLIAAIDSKSCNHKKQAVLICILLAFVMLLTGLAPIIKLSWHYRERASAFPVLADFDADWTSSFVRYNNAQLIKNVSSTKNGGRYLIRLDPALYPGVSIIEPEPDWSGYNQLQFKLFSGYQHVIELTLRIHDSKHNQQHDDRYNKKLLLQPGMNEFSIALSQVQQGPATRQLDLRSITGLTLFSDKPESRLEFGMDNFSLE